MNDFEEVETTRGEKILATAMVIFLLIGGVKILWELREIPERPDWFAYEEKHGIQELREEISKLQGELETASRILKNATKIYDEKNEEYLFRREEYRVMLEEGRDEEEVKERYEKARIEYEAAKSNLKMAQENYDIIANKIGEKQKEIQERQKILKKDYEKAQKIYEVKVLGIRLLFVLPLMVFAVYLFLRAREKKSKYLIHANAFLAFASLLLVYMILEHVWKTFHVIGMSFVGALITGGALAYLKKRIFSFEKISKSRIKNNLCPYCGFPQRGEFCRNCGKRLKEKCKNCGKKTYVLMPYCENCGKKL